MSRMGEQQSNEPSSGPQPGSGGKRLARLIAMIGVVLFFGVSVAACLAAIAE